MTRLPGARVGVVIPYFQRTPGTLARALRSVAAQTHRDGVQVVVVDDASPVPAADELARAGDLGVPVTVLMQANAGPGAARNRALDHLAAQGIPLAAFLDSDDEWRPHHLSHALLGLDDGHDFYFANLMQLEQTVSAFDKRRHLAAAEHLPLDAGRGLHRFRGDMLQQVVVGNVIGTPTVVYRCDRFPGVRFRPAFRRAGEDYLFWMDLARHGARFCFGTQVAVDCGRGVNVYTGAGWGTDGFAERTVDEMAYRLATLREFTLGAAARRHARAEVARLARAFALDLLHRARHRRAVPWGLMARAWRAVPALPLHAVQAVLTRGR